MMANQQIFSSSTWYTMNNLQSSTIDYAIITKPVEVGTC